MSCIVVDIALFFQTADKSLVSKAKKESELVFIEQVGH